MELKNLDPPGSQDFINRHFLAPQWPFRLLVAGGSGCGKTNMVMNLLLQYLHYDRLYVYSKHLDQPKMLLLRQFFDKVGEKLQQLAGGRLTPEDVHIAEFYSRAEDIIPVDQLDATKQNLVLFDDWVTEKDQDAVVNYFVRGRHSNCSVIYLTQSYFRTPKDIRLNCNYVAVYEVASGNEMRLLRGDQATNVSQEAFQQMYAAATAEQFSFLLIDRATKQAPLRFRRCFDHLWAPQH